MFPTKLEKCRSCVQIHDMKVTMLTGSRQGMFVLSCTDTTYVIPMSLMFLFSNRSSMFSFLSPTLFAILLGQTQAHVPFDHRLL